MDQPKLEIHYAGEQEDDMSRGDNEPLEPNTCGHSIGALGAGFRCAEEGPHAEHVWRGNGQASRGLGYGDNISTDLEVRWRDDRPAATIGDVRRAIAQADRTTT